MIRPLLSLVLGILLLNGCTPEQEDAGGPALPAQVEFQGKVDEKLVGKWKTASGDSVLDLSTDGSLKIESTFNTPKGKQQSSKEGKWLLDGEKLKLQYKEVEGSLLTIAYTCKHTGDTLVLSTKTPKLQNTYRRQ